MMLNFAELIKKYQIVPRGIIQLGVHEFQERDTFLSLGINYFVLIEPQKHIFDKMVKNAAGLNAICYNCAVSDFTGYTKMICETVNGSQSSSLLKPKEHLNEYPYIQFDHEEVVYVERLEFVDFDRTKYNILVMDLQGNELQALKGAGNLLDFIDCIYTEVNFKEMYEGCTLLPDLDSFLKQFNFKRVETGPYNQGWSDAFYLKG